MTVEASTETSLAPITAYGIPDGESEERALLSALRAGRLVGDGPIGRRVERQMEELFGVRHVLLTASCTAALEIAMLVLDIGPGDEVIMPSFTFVSTANSVILRGARAVFADICPGTLNLDPADVRRRITPRTRAIVPVHYAGVGCEMGALRTIATAYGLSIVEDAAQGVDAVYDGHYLGTIGDIGCYSFHATKNIVCGEGGAFVTNDDALARRAEIVREKGTNRSAFLRGEIDKYTWVSAGSSYILSDLLAALLEVQLARRSHIKARRRALWQLYYEILAPLVVSHGLQLPVVPPEAASNYHIFFLLARTIEEQKALINHLKAGGIPATFHYVPLHTSPFGRSLLDEPLTLPVTESAASRLVRLPLGAHLTNEQAVYVAEQVIAFYQGDTRIV